MLYLGGFINGSGVILWSLVSPLSALLFDDPDRAPYWFLGFLGLVVVSGIFQPFMGTPRLSDTAINVFFVMNLGGVSTAVFVMLSYFVEQRNIFQDKADNLLLSILPEEIADVLKDENRTIAEHFDGVSVLFADVVNFTGMSADMSPDDVVELLNEVFSEFDDLVEKYELEKIKTIGDCYMVAAGVPRPRADHAHVLTKLALEICEMTETRDFCGKKLDFRIGINSGPVVAGVIGRKKFIYDLWGDAVNTASRMESNGVGGVIQITRDTYELIRDDFTCEPQGTIQVKGKGEMEVWHILRQAANP